MKTKKLILFVCMICMSCCYCMAGSKINFVQGDKKFLKTVNGNFTLEFVWDGATYDNKMPLEDKFTNIQLVKQIAWNGFAEEFNSRSKTSKIVKGQEAKYKFTMKVDKMDQYFKVMGFIPANATKVWGTLTVTNTETNETIAIINMSEIDGGANPSPDGCIEDCFEELGKQVAKFK